MQPSVLFWGKLNMKPIIAIAAALAMAGAAAPALADEATDILTGYVNVGYSYADFAPAHLSVIHGRIGGRFGRYFGVEGEGAVGVSSDRVSQGGFTIDTKLKSEFAGYAIGFIPLGPKADLFGRVGYGRSNLHAYIAGVGGGDVSENSLNFGGGAQFFITPDDGIRIEYTRFDYRHNLGDADVYSVSYVRRFH